MARISVCALRTKLPRAKALAAWAVGRGPWAERRASRRAGWSQGSDGPRSTVHGPRVVRAAGFTLIELIIVVAIIGILATIAVPAMRSAPQRARESALKEDLFTLRSCIDQFHGDRARYPASLDELVSMGYLRIIPVDPVTHSRDTWVVAFEEDSEQQDERQKESGPGIIDIHSGSPETALDGSKYAEW
jgi:general secretion pathway protein G